MKRVIVIIILLFSVPPILNCLLGQDRDLTSTEYAQLLDRIERLEGRSFTRYDTLGLPVNQGEYRKGYHMVVGQVQLDSGRAEVNLNQFLGPERRDVSFLSAETYSGKVWSTDTTNANRYVVYPITGSQFIIKFSGVADDSSVVKFQVEGE